MERSLRSNDHFPGLADGATFPKGSLGRYRRLPGDHFQRVLQGLYVCQCPRALKIEVPLLLQQFSLLPFDLSLDIFSQSHNFTSCGCTKSNLM